VTTGFTHFDSDGRPTMVDVSEKPDTERVAIARAIVDMQRETRQRIEQGQIQKGDVLQVAQLAGIMGAKKTSDIIPLCHPLPLVKVQVVTEWLDSEAAENDVASLAITATVKVKYKTGVEMEALTACTTAALTVYDMCKAVDRAMTIRDVRLLYKTGGKSGTFDVRSKA
jgi:cyclic pyranopterin monophosphate synthase